MTKSIALDLTFSAGIDEAQRSELLDPRAGFVTLENVRQNKRGGITKRYGFTALTLSRLNNATRAVDTRSAAYRLFSHGEQACVIDGHLLDGYSTTMGASAVRDRVPEPACRFRGLPSAHAEFYTDTIYCNGYVVVASTKADPTGGTISLVVSFVDAATYEVVMTTVVASGFSGAYPVKLGSVSTDVVVFYQSATNTISARTISLATATSINTGWSSPTSIVTDADASGLFDTCSMTDRLALAYVNTSAGASRVSVVTVNAARATLESTTINTSSVTPAGVVAAGSIADTLWIGWNETTAAKVKGLTGNSLATVLATTATVASVASTSAYVSGIAVTGAGAGTLVCYQAGGSYAMVAGSFTTSAGAVSATSNQTWYRIGPTGRPFVVDGRVYVSAYNVDDGYISGLIPNGDRTRFVLDVTETSGATRTVRPVANITPGVAYGAFPSSPFTPHNVEFSATRIGLAHMTVQRQVGSAGAYVDAGAGVEELDFASSARWHTARHGGVTVLSGGVTSFYDGENVNECGFLVRPPKPTATLGGTGITGTFSYVAVYEHVDATGEVHVSGVSDPLTVTAANQTVTVSVANLFITARYDAASAGSRTRVALYRTAAGGTTYYRLTSWANDATAATTSYADATSSVTASPKLHRQPLVLGAGQDRRAPPASRLACVYNEMIVVASDMPGTIWHSAAKIYGEGAWFNPIWQQTILAADEITGFASQDGTLFVFSRRGIWAVNGEPPSDNAASGGLGVPRRLAVDVGCIDARSIVVTSLGVLFQSERGIEVLTRAQSVEWIGEPVQDTVASYPVCTAATLDPAASLVMFELAAGETANQVTGSGRTLVYDLTIRAWVSTDRRKNEAGTASTPAQGGALIYTGSAWRYAWLGTDGRVYVEDQTTHLDPGSAWVTMRASSSWIHVAGPQGEQFLRSIMALCERHTGHDLTFSVYHDYVDSSPGTKTISAASLAALTRQWVEYPFARAKGAAIKVALEDVTPSSGSVGTGKGATWIGLAFPGAPHQGAKRTSTGQRGA